MYLDDYIILTEFGEVMTYLEARNANIEVKRKATDKESEDYRKEYESLRKQEEEQLHEGSYHELPD